jgi:hypothetical protein
LGVLKGCVQRPVMPVVSSPAGHSARNCLRICGPVERSTRFVMLVALPNGHKADLPHNDVVGSGGDVRQHKSYRRGAANANSIVVLPRLGVC